MSYQFTGNMRLDSEIGVILPTYREAENIANLINDIEALGLDVSILVIDDLSPDGTADIVKGMQERYANILLCVRPTKTGLGTAITDGIKIFLSSENVPRYIVTLDADYSHNPKAIPQLLSKMKDSYGMVIGSRYCKGGKIVGWPFTRKIVSRIANLIAQTSLHLDLHDCTSGFRCYSTAFLKEAIGSLHSQTYEIQIETIRQAFLRNFQVKETPILFLNRKLGKSKLTLTEIKSYFTYILKSALPK